MQNQAYSRPLFDLFSFARKGPGRRDHLTPAEVQQVARTVRRTPEVVVKVFPTSASTVKAVRKHVGYIGRYGELTLETDDGEKLQGRDVGPQLIDDWDLDLDDQRKQSQLSAASGRRPIRIVHKLLLSMPPGTPAQGVLAAARDFLREEFALKHRYAFVLHTDEAHPHVHAVVKAVSEQGERLHIKKATLREWRQKFAQHLRDQGIEANATNRATRGSSHSPKLDGIFRAAERGESSHMRIRVEAAAADPRRSKFRTESGKIQLVNTRNQMEQGWLAAADALAHQGLPALAAEIREFVGQLKPPMTEREKLMSELRQRSRQQEVHKPPPRR